MNQREAFEKWAKSEFPNHSEMYFEWCEEHQHYAIDEVDFAWQAWQAAASIEREACAKVCDYYATAIDLRGNEYIRSGDCKLAAELIRNRK